jgi:hypothetical protein
VSPLLCPFAHEKKKCGARVGGGEDRRRETERQGRGGREGKRRGGEEAGGGGEEGEGEDRRREGPVIRVGSGCPVRV